MGATETGTEVRGAGRERRSIFGLILAFAATFLCFFASTIYTSSRLHEVTLHSEDVSANALPSVLHLSTVRAELRRLERAIDDCVDGRVPWTDEAVRAPLRRIDEALGAYRATADFPGEADAWGET